MQNPEINNERLDYFKEELEKYGAAAQVLLAIKADPGEPSELMVIVGSDWISEQETRHLLIQILKDQGYGVIPPASKN
jgi:hypothetical protein